MKTSCCSFRLALRAAAALTLLPVRAEEPASPGRPANDPRNPPARCRTPITQVVTPAAFLGDEKKFTGRVRVARLAGDRAGALSLVFDDGSRDHVDLAIPWLNACGLQGTFALNPAKIPPTAAEAPAGNKGGAKPVSWEEWKAAAAAGHEIANHGATHKGGSGWTTPEIAWAEVVQAQRTIEREIGRPCVSFVYAFNSPLKPANPLYEKYIQTHLAWVGPGRLWYGGGKWTLEQANRWADEAAAQGLWSVAMIHGIREGYSPFARPEDFKSHLDYLKSKQETLWVAPLGTVARYLLAAKACDLKVAEESAGRAVFALTSDPDAAPIGQPLTVVVDAPAPPREAKASRGDRPIEARLRGAAIQLDVRPGPEAVTVTWK
jgi:peptidoglycan/xylan/chitin deacetylase (PgdA/CDA1 family)